MIEQGREPIDQLADEFLDRYRRGEKPSLTEYVQAHPQLDAEIRELFPTLVLLERLSPRQDELVGQQLSADPIRHMPQHLGEYRIIREVGRGGMGIVYEAEQLPLGRHVALKVLPSSAVLSPSVLTRFQNEVRAAARLHHTNIVPVFGVGEDQGIHYYAMQFISGQGLDVVLEELRRLRCNEPATHHSSNGNEEIHGALTRGNSSSYGASTAEYFQSVARMGLHVAEAVAHAHSQGVLHRDIKPSNLLLDAQGSVWVTDFGLAKQVGCDVTNTGDVVGTLRYLAPERFRGTSDARSDIYGVGVTLYELLTTQPAFPATDRGRLVHDIVHAEPVPPRQLERRLPRDLETIVLKAMAKEPAERYAAAADLATDLRRFLDDKPIGARRLSPVERLWRWSMRRPALASLSTALLLSLVAGLGGAAWQWQRAESNLKEAVLQKGLSESAAKRANRNLQEADHQRTIAQQEAERAEANYHTARQAVDELLTMVSQDELKDQPGLQPLRVRLLTRALEYYQGMLEQRGNDPKARAELISSYLHVAEIKKLTGMPREAVEAYQKAIELLETMLTEGHESRSALQLVGASNNLALILIDDRQFDEASRLLLRAREVVERDIADEPSAGANRLTALTLNNIAWGISQRPSDDQRQQRQEEAIDLHLQALAIYRRLAREEPDDYAIQRGLSATLSNMGRRHMQLGRNEEAKRLLEECLALRLGVLLHHPASHDARYHVAATYEALGDVVARAGAFASDARQGALDYYEKALEILEPLTRDNPAVAHYRWTLADALQSVAEVHRRASELASALDAQTRAVAIFESFIVQDSGNWRNHHGLARACGVQATLERQLQRHEDSIKHRVRARQAWSEVLRLDPTLLPQFRNAIVANLDSLMQELVAAERLDDLHDVVALAQRELCDGQPERRVDLAMGLDRAMRAAIRGTDGGNQATIAEKCLDLAIETLLAGAAGAPENVTTLSRIRGQANNYAALVTVEAELQKAPDSAALLAQRSSILRRLGHSSRAFADWNRALEITSAALLHSPNNPALLRERAKLYMEVQRWHEAAADSARALAQSPNNLQALAYQAESALHLGQWRQANQGYARLWQRDRQQPPYVRHWCRAAHELGLEKDVIAHGNKLLDLVGEDAVRADAAAWQMLADRDVTRFPDLTLELGRRAVELKPNVIIYQATLGGIYYRLGRYDEAFGALEAVAKSSPGEASAFSGFWLAMIYHHRGEHDQAQAAYQRALRSWKAATNLSAHREAFLQEVWKEAQSLLGGSETPAARS